MRTIPRLEKEEEGREKAGLGLAWFLGEGDGARACALSLFFSLFSHQRSLVLGTYYQAGDRTFDKHSINHLSHLLI